MNIKTKKQKVNKRIFWILFAFLIVATNCFSYKNWNFKTYIYLPFYAYFFYVVISHKDLLHRTREEMKFSRLIIAMMVVPFLCFISYFSNGDLEWQSHPTTIITMCGSVTFMLYFVLHALQVNEKTVLRVILVAALCILFLQVVQQVIPSKAMFGIGSDTSDDGMIQMSVYDMEQRNGIYRYRISGVLFTILALCYSWQEVLKKQNLRNFIFFLLFAASMYLFVTRQYMIATVGMCVFSVFLAGKTTVSSKLKFLIPIALLAYILYSFSDALFGELFEQTQTQTQNSDSDVRTFAFAYYWNEIITNNLTMFFGAGPNSSAAARASQYNWFWVDIGLVGQWFAWGIGAILTYIILLYKIFFKRKYDVAPYVRFMAFLTFITSMLIYPYTGPVQFMAWSMALYVTDLHISHSPLAMK